MSRVTHSADDREVLLTTDDDRTRSEIWQPVDTISTGAESSDAQRCYIPLATHISNSQRADGHSNRSGHNSPDSKHLNVNTHPGVLQESSADNSTSLTEVVVMKPDVTTTVSVESVVNNYTALSVFTMVCCCLPIGLCALFYARDAQTMWLRGYIREALRRSRTSRNFNIAGITLGVVVVITVAVVLYFVVQFFMNRYESYYWYHH